MNFKILLAFFGLALGASAHAGPVKTCAVESWPVIGGIIAAEAQTASDVEASFSEAALAKSYCVKWFCRPTAPADCAKEFSCPPDGTVKQCWWADANHTTSECMCVDPDRR